MKLIIITWLPWTWKTSLAQKISEKLNIPYFVKDDFKEILYDEIWYSTQEEKRIFEVASLKVLYYIFEKFLKTNTSIILEANFYSEFSTKVFNDFKNKHDFDIFQIKCITEWKVLFDRFKKRAVSIWRHKWHWETTPEVINKWKPLFLEWKFEKLHIWGTYIELDTTNFEKIDYKILYDDINEFLK